ncbi:LytR/AlgR family response regulator transcription factor [Aureispira anguillae]|uniref:LytTR family DNA-binding domain-containing protein n=1 Tax=Aureispira anguillae TaxID=2864201 RepID=A0A915YDC4_9BACT|nr:LytTR family DNA-binding domain-containing protein [Aureispira anguillae]BDS11018.1 LytTR family DNA-binding domain-containing protein [Aureispira anguillae]
MRTVIIDDEPKARRLLSTILNDFCPQIISIQEAENLMDGIQLIKKTKPDIVFLDIEMPDYLGIEIGSFLDAEEMTFHLIFTTAYSHYAIKAFEVNAVDYLLKPIRPKQVKEALKKIVQRAKNEDIYRQLSTLQESIQNNSLKKIAVPISNGILFLKIEDIICMEADGMYTKLHTQSNGTQVISKPLRYFVDLLKENEAFYRSHRSYLINVNFIQQYIKKDGHTIVLENQIKTPLARDKRASFLAIIDRLT